MPSRRETKIFRYGIFLFQVDCKCSIVKTEFVKEPIYKVGDIVTIDLFEEDNLKAEVIELHDDYSWLNERLIKFITDQSNEERFANPTIAALAEPTSLTTSSTTTIPQSPTVSSTTTIQQSPAASSTTTIPQSPTASSTTSIPQSQTASSTTTIPKSQIPPLTTSQPTLQTPDFDQLWPMFIGCSNKDLHPQTSPSIIQITPTTTFS